MEILAHRKPSELREIATSRIRVLIQDTLLDRDAIAFDLVDDLRAHERVIARAGASQADGRFVFASTRAKLRSRYAGRNQEVPTIDFGRIE